MKILYTSLNQNSTGRARFESKRIKTRYLFDCSFITPSNRYKSIPTYAIRFVKALPNDVVTNSVVLVGAGMVDYFQSINSELCLVVFNNKYVTRIPYLGRKYNELILNRCMRSIEFESVLIFDELRYANLFATKSRKVSIFHDLKSIKEDTAKKEKNKKYYKSLIESCDALIAISEYTKQDILKYYRVDEKKLHVVYNSIILPDSSVKPKSLLRDMEYILYVNTLQPYKNAMTLVKAFNMVRSKYDLNLVFVGKSSKYWEDEVLKYSIENGFNDRIIRFQDVPDEELRYLYEHARLFVTTSLHEGFGYTPVEAAICKCPVISSTCEALPDTTQNLLYYYEPAMSPQALCDKLVEVLDNPPSEALLLSISEKLKNLYSPARQVSSIINVMDGK